jgi:methylmalonyl-CoA decarboxylase
MALVLLDLHDDIATITLNNDAKRNALGTPLINELTAAFEESARRQVRAAILRAQPRVRVWSAGHDISELPRTHRDPLPYNDPLEQLIRAVREFHAPVLALVEGSVWGAACELVVACDIPIGAPSATFALTPARIGVPYNPAGLLRIMNEIDPSIVKEMFFTAQPMPAQRALDVGLLNHLVPAEEIDRFALDMATTIASRAPLSISVIKEQIRLLCNAYPLAPETFERIQGLRRAVYDSADYIEGISAFLEKRTPRWTGK